MKTRGRKMTCSCWFHNIEDRISSPHKSSDKPWNVINYHRVSIYTVNLNSRGRYTNTREGKQGRVWLEVHGIFSGIINERLSLHICWCESTQFMRHLTSESTECLLLCQDPPAPAGPSLLQGWADQSLKYHYRCKFGVNTRQYDWFSGIHFMVDHILNIRPLRNTPGKWIW